MPSEKSNKTADVPKQSRSSKQGSQSEYIRATEIVQRYTEKARKKARKRGKSNNFRLRNLKYYLSETLHSLVRNKLMTLTSIATVAACLLIVVLSFAITQNINHVLAYIETTVGIEVFIDDELNDAQVEMLGQNILALDNVAYAEFVHPDDALVSLAERRGDEDGLLMAFLYDNPLRRAFRLELRDIREQRYTVDAIWRMHGVANIAEAGTVADFLGRTNNYISLFGVVLILIFAVLSVVIITNTIKLTVNNRRNEILIMRYVGATDWFIKWPFVIEGVLIGVLGAAISLVISWFSYEGIISAIRGFPLVVEMQLPLRDTAEVFSIFAPIAVVLGAIIGVLGSISSMRKYLSV